MDIHRIERWGSAWRFVRLRGRPSAQSRREPKVHKIKHYRDEGDFIEEKMREEEERETARFDSSLSRAKTRVTELALCNPWSHFVTMTLCKEKQDRFDLKRWVKDLGNWIQNYNKKFGCKLQYLIIPEKHDDGAWHAHGLMNGLAPESLVINEHGYLDLPYYRNRFGYISFSAVKSHERVARYITKYITKDQCQTCRDMGRGARLYYASRGLALREVVWQGWLASDYRMIGAWHSEWCDIKWISSTEAIETLSEVMKNESIHHRREYERQSSICDTQPARTGGARSKRRELAEGGTRTCAQGGTGLHRTGRETFVRRGREGDVQVTENERSIVDKQPTETDSERIEREQKPMRDKIAYSVSSPKRNPYFDDTGMTFEDQLTFFGK